ncbi:MAG: hypothetical protein F4205_04670 [Gemmatimonadetes bacterium]|nr:hypothetical protein [Gemmatimonadota bacterium]MXX73393.1 hypothetical protein [Gemmatimonadota bacterium]MYC90176.1 hypothetical protein [Gemmatimonadota bacterium]MYG34765.1 hypothetical protein [Gemmatimonadota bacterium]
MTTNVRCGPLSGQRQSRSITALRFFPPSPARLATVSAGLIAFGIGACDNPQPPAACGPLPRVTVNTGEATVVSACFNDPNGDVLTYSATSSNLGVATASAAGATITVTALSPGNTTVTVTATDPEGLKGQQVFQVTVPNRPPLVRGIIPDQTIIAGQNALVNLSRYFTEPDGQKLSYSAAAADPGVAGVSVTSSALTIAAVGKGATNVTVTAIDTGGLTAQHLFQVTVPNRAPEILGAIPDQTLDPAQTLSVKLSLYFNDPDGDSLTYDAVSSDPETVAVTASAATVSVSGVARGEASITVVASDPGGLQAQSSFRVTVAGAHVVGFQIDLAFATALSSAQQAAFYDAAERWMTILTNTELPDVTVNGPLDCAGEYEQPVETIDDLMIVASVVEIDGPGAVLGRAGPCRLRSGSYLPYFGRMEFDVADLEEMERSGTLKPVILHEMAHVLGIGTLWQHLNLLANPSLEAGRQVDTYLPLPLAVAAFDQAGGVGYTGGGKVPVANKGIRPGSDDGHWRKSVLGTELMTSAINAHAQSIPLSAISIQALADLGYTVDLSLADAYRLPTAAAVAESLEHSIDLGNDIIRGLTVVTDRNGRVVRIIPPLN